jgi:hypothetical protein
MDGEYGGCDSGEHYIYEPVSVWLRNAQGSVHNCLSNSCAEEHACSAEGVPLADLATAITNGDVQQLTKFLDTHAESLTLNRMRDALQVTGCSGRVVAHFQTSKAIVDALSTTVAN